MPPRRTRETEAEPQSKKKKENFHWTPEQIVELVSLKGQNRSWSDIASKFLSVLSTNISGSISEKFKVHLVGEQIKTKWSSLQRDVKNPGTPASPKGRKKTKVY
jgi:hypothetical protein